MALLSEKLLSISFVVLPIFAFLWFTTKIFRHIRIEITIQALDQLSDDQKRRIVHLYRRIISGERIVLWAILFIFLLLLAAFLLLTDGEIRRFLLLAGLLLVVGYMHFVEDTLYKKKILKAIDKQQ